MDSEISYLIKKLDKNAPLNKEKFEKVIQSIDCKFPTGYLEFMRQYNGCEGGVLDGQWLVLWPIEELQSYNEMYGASEFAPELLLIGSNGGAIAYGIERKEGIFIKTEYVRMSKEDAVQVGNNFQEFLYSLANFAEMGTEYAIARAAADKTNRKMHERDRSLKGMHLHEIKPIILGGDPFDEANKVPLASDAHSKYTRWWKTQIDEIKDHV